MPSSSPQSRPAMAVVGYGYRQPGGLTNDEELDEFFRARGTVRVPVDTRYGKRAIPVQNQWMAEGLNNNELACPYEGLILNDEEIVFDYTHFGISKFEAGAMDPQAKMALQCSWEAAERAGVNLRAWHNMRVGVYMGVQVGSGAMWKNMYGPSQYDMTGFSLAMCSNRISYHLNLTGPSFSVNTACSSGATATHLGTKGIASGECSDAIVGSGSYLGNVFQSIAFNKLRVMSPTGRSHCFDAQANGYLRSEGVTVMIIKDAMRAEREGDTVHIMILATEIACAGAEVDAAHFSSGRTITKPVTESQADLMSRTLKEAGKAPNEFSYLEAHSTGTPVGDGVEGKAIADVFGVRDTKLRIASLRSNIGHQESSSFSSSLLKAILMCRHRTFYPISTNYKSLNPEVPFDNIDSLCVQTDVEPFPSQASSVVMGINSFGFGGAYTNCVVKEHRRVDAPSPEEHESVSTGEHADNVRHVSAPLSAKSVPALQEMARAYAVWMQKEQVPIRVLAQNLWNRRSRLPVRRAFTASTAEELMASLNAFADEVDPSVKRCNEDKMPIVVFSGQGSQWPAMGKSLYETDAVFRRTVDLIDVYWEAMSGHKLSEKTFELTGDEVHEPVNAQSCTFLVQAAMYESLKSRGMTPCCIVGHSAGESMAACASDAYSLEEACYLVYHRATLQQTLSGCGRMLVVLGIEYEPLMEILAEEDFAHLGLELACRNSPVNTVITSTAEAIAEAKNLLEKRELRCKLIRGTTAFHSRQMEPIKESLYAKYAHMGDHSPVVPMISTARGEQVKALNTDYWWDNVRKPVLFTSALDVAAELFPDAPFVEISPHPTLVSPAKECLPSCTYITTMDRKVDSALALENAIGVMYETGVSFDRVPIGSSIAYRMPTYPFVKEVCLNANVDAYFPLKLHPHSMGPLVGKRSDASDRRYETTLSQDNYSYMTGHKINGVVLFPAAGYIECLLEAFDGEPIVIENMEIAYACEIPDSKNAKNQKILETAIFPMGKSETHYRFKIGSRYYREQEVVHCTGTLRKLESDEISDERLTPEYMKEFNVTTFDSREEIYSNLETKVDKYFEYGGLFKIMQSIKIALEAQEMLNELELSDYESWDNGGYIFHPAHLDGVLQTFCVIGLMQQSTPYRGVPTGIQNLHFYRKPSGPKLYVHYKAPRRLEGIPRRHGILSLKLGPTDSGGVKVFDGQTGLLVASIDTYVSTQSIASFMKEDPQMRLVWQPKLMGDLHVFHGANLVSELRALIESAKATNNRVLSIAEIIAVPPEEEEDEKEEENDVDDDGKEMEKEEKEPTLTLLDEVAESLYGTDVRYSVLCEEIEPLVEVFDRTGPHHNDIIARFHKLDVQALTKLSGAFDVLVVKATTSVPTESLVAPAGYVIRLSDVGGSCAAGWETVELPSSDAGFTLERKPKTMADYTGPPREEGDSADAKEEAKEEKEKKKEQHENEDTANDESDATPLRVVLGQNVFADRFRESESLRTSFAAYPESIYFFFSALDETLPSDEHSAAWALIDWFTDALPEVAVPSTIVVVTSGGVTPNDGHDDVRPKMRALWGSFRSVKEEYADYKFVIVDIGALEDVDRLGHVLALGEDELIVRGEDVYCPRFRKQVSTSISFCPDGHGYRLMVNGSGSLDDLKFELFERIAPPDALVEIRIKASALNFRDIMVSLSRLPFMSYERSGLGKTVGMECAGVVTRVGPNVTNFEPGDEVIAIGPALIADYALLPEMKLMKKPDAMSFERACAYPSVYITAYYALMEHAKLRKGHTLLVHSALGGVGIAAINIAKAVGATVYATAGTDEKRDKLVELGCAGVFDSHSLNWYAGLMEATANAGVNVVLNSLAGEHLDLCLKCLSAGGTHCEIGKMDVFEDRPLHMMVFRKNLKVAVIDIDRLGLDDPELLHELFVQSADYYKDGEHYAMPITTFPYAEYDKAMRYMMKGQHTGKIVLLPPDDTSSLPLPVPDTRMLFVGWPKTVVMTGATGGIGIRMFAYLADNGVKNFLLLDRDPELKRGKMHMIRYSALAYYHRSMPEKIDAINVKTHYVDLTDSDMVAHALSPTFLSSLGLPELGAIIHLAGVNDDKFLVNISEESMKHVFQSKVRGALNLHNACKDQTSVEHFVVFSSIVSVLGNSTQATYSAANAFLDGLIESRHSAGLPGISYNMAAVMDAGGMASDDVNVLKGMIASGVRPISCIEALNSLDIALRAHRANPGGGGESSHIISFAATRFKPSLRDSRRIGHLVKTKEAFTLSKSSGELNRASVLKKLSAKVCEVCDTDSVEVEQPLSDLGLNSVSMVELANFIQYEYEVEISPMKLMTGSCLGDVADTIIESITNTKSASQDETQGKKVRTTYKVGEELDKYIDGLPKFCRQDFDSLRYRLKGKNMRKVAQKQRFRWEMYGDAPASADDEHDAAAQAPKKNAFVTGASGFLGRFLIADLMEHDSVGKVYCLVRRKNNTSGADRLAEAMRDAGVWNDAYFESGRLLVVEGDVEERRLGLTSDTWDLLTRNVDTIYHFAANISLFTPYEDLRESNTRSMIDLMDMCFAGCKKEFNYASTLGIFPQYLASFRGRFKDATIDLYARPDIDDMVAVFPKQIGYPWTKLLSELMVEEARTQTGLSANIFRIPLTYTASKTGYIQTTEFFVKILQAAFVTGYSPSPDVTGAAEQNHECGSSVTQIIADLSLRDGRSSWVYHCLPSALSQLTEDTNRQSDVVNVDLHREVSKFAAVGTFDIAKHTVKYLNYREYRKRFYSTSPDSILYGQWPLLDYFGGTFWYVEDDDSDNGDASVSASAASKEDSKTSEKEMRPPPRVDVSAVQNDLGYAFSLTSDTLAGMRTVDWLSRNNSSFKDDFMSFVMRMNVSVDERIELIGAACNTVGLDLETVMPTDVQDNFKTLATAMDTQEKRETLSLRTQFDFWVSQRERVLNRIQLVRSFERFPEIASIDVRAPIFIVGLNRTGTTFLHRLLHASGVVDSVTLKDQVLIADPDVVSPETYAAIQEQAEERVDTYIRWQEIGLALLGVHEGATDGDVPEEELEPMSRSFSSPSDHVSYDIPDFLEHVEAKGKELLYEEHRRWVQYQTWLRRTCMGHSPDRWLFKFPFHMRSLPELFRTYPDAVIIHTHRPTAEVMPSWCKLVEEVRKANLVASEVDKVMIGKQQMEFVSESLDRVAKFRSERPDLADRFIDVQFRDFIANPLGVVQVVAKRAGLELGDAHVAAMTEYVNDFQKMFPKGISYAKPNTLEEYGLAEALGKATDDEESTSSGGH